MSPEDVSPVGTFPNTAIIFDGFGFDSKAAVEKGVAGKEAGMAGWGPS